MKFLDEAVITVQSGAGGNGCMSFRREKFMEYGGPDGGNGGNGGSIWLVAEPNLNTLVDYRFKQHLKAGTGVHGMGRNRTGAQGEDLEIPVPPGTEILDEATGAMLADLLHPGQRMLLLPGGRGGRGNASYKSSTHQAPREFTPGEPSQLKVIRLRLKLIADVGLVGLPNAGKSTLLSKVSRAKPKIADYPFTTLNPGLGLVRVDDQEMLVADLPGLIEGAAEGVGLGHAFLKHLSRCAVILHMVDANQPEPWLAYRAIRAELKAYDKAYATNLAAKPEVVALSKADTLAAAEQASVRKAFASKSKTKPMLLSAATREGLDAVVQALLAPVLTARGV